MNARAVVTGVGVIAPNGAGTDLFWKASREGVAVLDRISRDGCADLPLAVAGEVRGFDPSTGIEGRYLVQTDRFTHFALAAADEALADAGLLPTDPATTATTSTTATTAVTAATGADGRDPFSVGVVTASCSGGGEFGQRELQHLWGTGPRAVGPYQSIAWFYAASTGQISIRCGFKGPCAVLADDEAGGLDAIAHACRTIAHGTDAVVVGGTEAPLAPYSMVCQLGYPELSTGQDPAAAYLPFTTRARGFVPAEGGAMFVVEDEASARRRGARVRAVVAGHGSTFTGTSRGPRGWADSRHGLARAAATALDQAGLRPDDVDVVFADALGVPEADRAEALALADLFGPRAGDVPVTAPKTGIGRAFCGAAAIDTATAVLALEQGCVPPTPNITDVCHDVDLVTGTARPAPLRTALVLSRGLMGCNAALVLRRGDEPA